MREHYVYSKCFAGKGIYLQHNFTGTRSQCQTWIKNMARAGRMTHWYLISCLNHDAATRRYGE